MSWIRSSPFRRDDDPKDYMINLISREAEAEGVPLSEAEKQLLSEEFIPERTIPTELRERFNRLIVRILEREKNKGENEKSFGAALEWVEPEYPNVAALAEEVISPGGFGVLPRAHGKAWVKYRAQLIGCAIALVLVVTIIAISFLFDRK